MVDNSCVPSENGSPTSENGSQEPNSRSSIAPIGRPSALGGSIKGGGDNMMIGLPQNTNTNNKQILTPPSHPHPPPTYEHPTFPKEELNTPPLSKRPRGRPRGSKNKPKSPIIDNTLKSIVIEIPPENDVIEYLINFACSHQVNLIVISGSGIVSDIHIRHPNPHYGYTLIYHGLYRMIALSGTYMNFHFPRSSSIANNPPCVKNFTIRVFGSQGVVYNGIVAGKVMAASHVVVNALISKNFEYHKAPYIDGNMLIEEGEEHSSSFSDQHSSGSNTIVVSTKNA